MHQHQVVFVWKVMSTPGEEELSDLRHTLHNTAAKKPVTRLHASCLVLFNNVSEPDCLTSRQAVELRDILSDFDSYFTQDHCQ